MKPHPRIRKTVKWGGAAVTVVLVAAWIGSRRWFVVGAGQGSYVGIANGAFGIGEDHKNSSKHYEFILERWPPEGLPAGGLRWWFLWKTRTGGWSFEVPLWVPFTGSLAATVLAWRLDTLARRRREGQDLCPKCNYDRAGLAAGAVCPECGAAPASSPT